MPDVEPAAARDTLVHAEAALEASHELILLVDGTPAAQGGPFVTFANTAYLRETGYAAADVLGRPLDHVMAPAGEAWAGLVSSGPSPVNLPARRRDGTVFAYEGEATPVRSPDGSLAGHVLIGRNGHERNLFRDRLASVVSALEHADDNVFVLEGHVDEDSYRVIFANESVYERTGYTREEFQRYSTRILNGPLTDQPLRQRALAELRAGRKARIETVLYRKDGSPYWSELSAAPIADESGRFTRWVLIERDVTERRREREELDVLWAAFANAHDSIIVYQRPQSGTRPRIVYVNEATVVHSGFSREELISGSTGIGPNTDLVTVQRLREAMVRGEPMRARLALYRKDGSMYWGEVDGRPVRDGAGANTHWISIERDITDAVERERALSALLDASQKLFGVLDGTALDAAVIDAVHAVVDVETAAIVPATEPLVARALAGAHGVAADAARVAIALRASGRDARGVVAVLAGGREPSADDRAVLGLLAQTYAAAARNAALFDEVHQQRAAVLELSRMKGDLISMLAHDLNNPLTAIRGFAEFLAEEQLDDSEGRIATTSIIRATERLVALGKETLALARLEDNALVPSRSEIDYTALLREIAAEVAPNAAVVADGVIRGDADPVLVRGLFENLLGNAVKYSEPSSPVTVHARIDGDAEIVVEVEDHGIGIRPDEVERVFDRFARGSNARQAEIPGTGFGLYFARLVVQRHGGTIAIESRLKEGTRVVVRLPRNPPFSAQPRVLLLEPDEHAASYTEHILRDAGYHVAVVHDLRAFEDGVADDGDLVAIVPDFHLAALEAARRAGLRVVALRKPYLARDLLRELQNAG